MEDAKHNKICGFSSSSEEKEQEETQAAERGQGKWEGARKQSERKKKRGESDPTRAESNAERITEALGPHHTCQQTEKHLEEVRSPLDPPTTQ